MRISKMNMVYALALSVLIAGCVSASDLPVHSINLPPGFEIEVYAEDVWNARSMSQGPEGVIFVGTRRGEVYAVLDENRDFRADRIVTIARRLNMPNGVAYKDGSLYVAEVHRIIRFDNIPELIKAEDTALPASPVIINDSLPRDKYHGWKYLQFGPDGLLYVPVGAPCNVCESADDRHAVVMRMNPDGSELEIYARGIRNTVGFDWHPATGDFWFTDNGRDWMGDDDPPDELNRASAPGMHFGFPYIHGNDTLDPDYGRNLARVKESIGEITPPEYELGPHVAALGMRFYTGAMFPQKYRGQIFIAEHGSWNRSVPIGYRITLVRFTGEQPSHYEVFADGWLPSGGSGDSSAWGRPVDILILSDGSMLVSDDYGDAIYRISYKD